MKKYIFFFLWLLGGLPLWAQKMELKTNLLGDATTTLNAGLEVAVKPKWTVALSGAINPWTFKNDKKMHLWVLQPEAKYWFCENFVGHFLGLQLLGGQFNAAKVKMPFGLWPELEDTRFQGWGVGGGVTYGYQWLLSRHWSLEAAIGVGYIRVRYDQFPCAECGDKIDSGKKNYFGPTKAAVNLIYAF